MKKYSSIRIIDNDGNLIYEGSFINLCKRFNNRDECLDYIEDCKEKGYYYSSRTTYYDFEYDNPYTKLSENWLEDILRHIDYECPNECIEKIIKLSFKCINKVKVNTVGNCHLIVLPSKYDSLIIKQPHEILSADYFTQILREVYNNLNGTHNRTNKPKIRIIAFIDNWRLQSSYVDYNEGWRFYYNKIPDVNKLKLIFK